MKKVSICIPTYENPVAFERLMKSVVIQNYPRYEVIISDDSRDCRVETIARQYADLHKDIAIEYYHNDSPLGPTRNTNNACSKANGEYIKVMHHDDSFACRDSLSRMVGLLEADEKVVIAFTGTNELFYDESGALVKEKSYSRHISEIEKVQLESDYRNLFIVNMIGAPSATIFRRGKAYFDNELKWLVDIDYYIELLSSGGGYAFLEEPLINIGLSATQVTRSCLSDSRLMFKENVYVYKKFSLGESLLCRKHLIRHGILLGMRYRDYADTDIKFFQYLQHKLRISLRSLVSAKKV